MSAAQFIPSGAPPDKKDEAHVLPGGVGFEGQTNETSECNGAMSAPASQATTIESDTDARLLKIRNGLRHAVDAVGGHLTQAVKAALHVGELLLEAKSLVGHGEWANWIAANSPIAMRTAQAYMRLTEKCRSLGGEDAQRVAQLPLREVIKAMQTPAEAPARSQSYCVRNVMECDRVVGKFTAATKALNELKKFTQPNFPIRAQKIISLRSKLQEALAEVEHMLQSDGKEGE